MNTASIREEHCRLPSDGDELDVVWTTSTAPTHRPTRLAILLHGGPEGSKDGPSDVFRKLAYRLASAGIASVRFDFRGQGQSSGDYVEMTMAGQRADFDVVYSEAQRRGYSQLAIVGESFGATCALGAYRRTFAAMVLLWPAIYLLDKCFAPFFEEPHKTELDAMGYIQIGNDRVGSAFLTEVVAVNNLEPRVREITCPTLLIHGTSDREVPYHQSERAYALLPEPKRIVIVPNADHCLRTDPEQAIVFSEVLSWLLRYL